MKTFRNLILGVMILGAVGAFLYADEAEEPENYGPDVVTIGGISHWFSPVVFPHAMHAEFTGDCESCHHNSDGEAVECSVCHEEVFEPSSPELPPLNVAYHLNCIVCHQEADAPTGCEDCHSRAALPPGPELK